MESDEENVRKLVYQLSYYEAQARDLQRSVEMLQNALEEALSAQSAISGLSKAEGTAIFPLGSRVFVLAKPEKKGKLLVEAGSGVMVEKTHDEASAQLEDSIKKIREGLGKAQGQLADISKKAAILNAQAEELSRKTKGK